MFVEHEYQAATIEYGRALAIDPKSSAAHYGLGCIAIKRERYQEALNYLGLAVAVDEKHCGTHRVLGLVHREVGDCAKAIAHFERASDLASTDSERDELRKWLAEFKT